MGGPDPDLEAILAMHDVAETDFLGSGGEARVYALDDERVLRVFHPGAPVEIVFDRSELVDELAAGNGAGFALSTTDEIGSWEGRCYAIEARLTGTTVLALLATLEPRRAPRSSPTSCGRPPPSVRCRSATARSSVSSSVRIRSVPRRGRPSSVPGRRGAWRATAPTSRRSTPPRSPTKLYEPVRRWLAAFWSFATDDVALRRWCRRVLLGA